jgi:D-hydroxyproline dehydrogenase subunit gamma
MTNVVVNGRRIEVPEGATVAAAVMRAGAAGFAPLCGMGICFGCRVTLGGREHERSCQTPCREGMEVSTGDAS